MVNNKWAPFQRIFLLLQLIQIKRQNHQHKNDLSAVFVIKSIDRQPVYDIINGSDIEVEKKRSFIYHTIILLFEKYLDEGMLKPSQLHRVRCLENGCTYQMLAISDLRNHLANHHLKPEYKTTEEKKFNSFAGKFLLRRRVDIYLFIFFF